MKDRPQEVRPRHHPAGAATLSATFRKHGARTRPRDLPRSRPRSLAARSCAADGRGAARGRGAALVRARRFRPRPRQGAESVRRAAMGGGRRDVPGQLRILEAHRLPRALCGEPRFAESRLLDATRSLREGLRARPRSLVVGTRRVSPTRPARVPARAGARDRELFEWVRRFNNYDLYSKSDAAPDWKTLRPWYAQLVAEFVPERLWW